MGNMEVMNARELEGCFGEDGEHPELTRCDWRDAVAMERTVCGYWDWVASVMERKLIWEDEP